MECNGQNMLGMKTTKMGKKCLKKRVNVHL